jgi:hypothetical protein
LIYKAFLSSIRKFWKLASKLRKFPKKIEFAQNYFASLLLFRWHCASGSSNGNETLYTCSSKCCEHFGRENFIVSPIGGAQCFLKGDRIFSRSDSKHGKHHFSALSSFQMMISTYRAISCQYGNLVSKTTYFFEIESDLEKIRSTLNRHIMKTKRLR